MKAPLALVPVVLASAITPPVSASESICFMNIVGGRSIDLTKLCGQPARSGSSPATAKTNAISRPEVMRSAATDRGLASVNRWQRAAQSATAMRPFWSGYCQSSGQPCHVRRPTGGQISRNSLGAVASGRVCTLSRGFTLDGRRCDGR
ncbi:MAG: hypothetical protein MUF72_13210 [Elainella sp. Prado103]|nr:hypothetical protein [Elainella sp. Prado103]